MKSRALSFICAALLVWAAGPPALADDGAITNKDMSRTINLPDFGQDIVNNAVPEDEHAFTDMMGFYVPAQAASGEVLDFIAYCDVDNTPEPGEDCTNAVEELTVAKPLVNVFIHGPLFGVPETAFGHSFMDTYAAVSLDDGETWKQTNLSESADLSSFNIGTDHRPSRGDPLPGDHNIRLGNAFHAKGYDTPYSSECRECHGVGLQGVAEVPSCYSCHGQKWSEPTPVEIGPVIYLAEYQREGKKGGSTRLSIEGTNAPQGTEVTILNAITEAVVGTTEALPNDIFRFDEKYSGGQLPPCVVFAEYTDNQEVLIGPSLVVKDKKTGEPLENCEGQPVDITDYPGGTYNVFHATAGNKVLVAWPSRFCSQGQPAYTMSPTQPDPDITRADAVVGFIQSGDEALGVPALPDFNQEDDLYLVDAFGVAGRQGSIDFATEGYPQAGVVPFGCVWTARGVLLPGDDPRTTENVESSHMVWTKAERLTSGRRDPNRIEVKAVKGAGFVITWQEDPEGLRPGQGLGPGEGWSGAVAHSQTDVWYSFINEEYFDIVETVDNTTVPINILDHDLTLSGRPQVFVPMSVPMRMTNNARCNPPDPDTGEITDDLYCDFALAGIFGIKNQCADTVTLLTGNPNSPSGQTETDFCVADIDGDGDADLVGRANTASTRPRLGLQGYDSDADELIDSGWVVFATEESKGLGAFFFEPDGLLNGTFDGFADPCDEGSSLTCTSEIGKNQWYHSFDMGTPDTSGGIGDPDSLVSNLVYQGDMLNQGEVY
ncbi:MAG: choice-of-anchor O protein, partial [Chromatiales bacterium]